MAGFTPTTLAPLPTILARLTAARCTHTGLLLALQVQS